LVFASTRRLCRPPCSGRETLCSARISLRRPALSSLAVIVQPRLGYILHHQVFHPAPSGRVDPSQIMQREHNPLISHHDRNERRREGGSWDNCASASASSTVISYGYTSNVRTEAQRCGKNLRLEPGIFERDSQR
jgi:hypothetical protein